MQRAACFAILAACGGSNKASVDAPGGPDSPAIDASIDAPVLPACSMPVTGTTIRFRRVGTITGDATVLVTAPVGDPRLFVVGRSGVISIFDAQEALLPDPFLDLSANASGPVLSGGGTSEQGLLGLAFHPQYASNGTFFIDYTRRETTDPTNTTRDVVARCQVSATDPNKAEPTCTEILQIPDFASNHNAGMIEFGKDGFLYISTGDGGQANDPHDNGQAVNDSGTVQAWLGKMLRIDVDHKAAGMEYGIPADNPFANGGGKPEIYQLGLRNPWRWSFDSATGDEWIGDVGQDAIEELDVVPAGQQNGVNFGWSMWEASACFKAPCSATGIHQPQDERTHAGDGWASIIGGQVYRGSCYPDIVGTYFYADFVGNHYAKATLNGDGSITKTDLAPGGGDPPFPTSPTSLHADARGELYLTTLAGTVFHLEAAP